MPGINPVAFCRIPILIFALTLVLVGCDVDEPRLGAAEDDTVSVKAQNDDAPGRLVSLYLEPQLPISHAVVFDGRVVSAEPVYTVPASMARAHGLVEGISVVYVGKSCKNLQARYPDLRDCAEEETVEFEYGEVIATAETDSEGFATMMLGGAEKYRISVRSWATEEDDKCFWGGEDTIDNTESEVKIPLLIFCE